MRAHAFDASRYFGAFGTPHSLNAEVVERSEVALQLLDSSSDAMLGFYAPTPEADETRHLSQQLDTLTLRPLPATLYEGDDRDVHHDRIDDEREVDGLSAELDL